MNIFWCCLILTVESVFWISQVPDPLICTQVHDKSSILVQSLQPSASHPNITVSVNNRFKCCIAIHLLGLSLGRTFSRLSFLINSLSLMSLIDIIVSRDFYILENIRNGKSATALVQKVTPAFCVAASKQLLQAGGRCHKVLL